MYPRAFFHRRRAYPPEPEKKGGRAFRLAPLLTLLGLFLFVSAAGLFLKDLSTQIAVSDARDFVTLAVNKAVTEIMGENDYDGDYFIRFEKNAAGEVTAISSNMARINALSAQILDRVVGETESKMLTVEIPLGNLTGISLLMGRGPGVPVQIIALTSSRVEFQNSIVTAGINQTKHQITLQVLVDIDILVPWGTETTQAVSEVLIADTIIVGQVPGTYVNYQP